MAQVQRVALLRDSSETANLPGEARPVQGRQCSSLRQHNLCCTRKRAEDCAAGIRFRPLSLRRQRWRDGGGDGSPAFGLMLLQILRPGLGGYKLNLDLFRPVQSLLRLRCWVPSGFRPQPVAVILRTNPYRNTHYQLVVVFGVPLL
jgi:hypothetical protein